MAQLLLDFMSESIEGKPNIVGRSILPTEGKAILGGAPKSNKSFVVLNMALDIAKGQNLFGARYKNETPVFPVTKPWTVLLMEQEIGGRGLKGRMAGILSGEPDRAVCPFYVKSKDTALRLDTMDGLAAIEREVDECRPDVLIMDPFSKFHGLDENSAQDMGRVLRTGDFLIQKYHLSILYIHHTGLAVYDKDNARRGGARLRGSSAIFADVDTFIEVNRMSAAHSAEPTLSLSFELRQGEPVPPQMVKRLRNGQISYIGENVSAIAAAGI